MFINAQSWSDPQPWIDTGWYYDDNNPCRVVFGNGSSYNFSAFWAFTNTTTSGPYAGGVYYGCAFYYPSGDNVYAVQFSGSDGRWYHLFNGHVIHSERFLNLVTDTTKPDTGYTTLDKIAAFGQTTSTSMQMGGAGLSNQILISGISYMPATGGNWAAVNNYQTQPSSFDLGIDPSVYPYYRCPPTAPKDLPCLYQTHDNEQGIWWVSLYTQ
jgi:hypothetical protein